MGQPLMIFKLSLCDNELQGMEVPDVAFFFSFTFVCGAFRANISLLHTHTLTHLSRPSFLFVWGFFCFVSVCLDFTILQ